MKGLLCEGGFILRFALDVMRLDAAIPEAVYLLNSGDHNRLRFAFHPDGLTHGLRQKSFNFLMLSLTVLAGSLVFVAEYRTADNGPKFRPAPRPLSSARRSKLFADGP